MLAKFFGEWGNSRARLLLSRLRVLSLMALNTLKHRNVAEVDRMFEGLVCLVARFAFAIRQAAEIHRVLNRQSLDHRFRARGVR